MSIQQRKIESVEIDTSQKQVFATKMAKRILGEVMIYRRVLATKPSCGDIDCHRCTSPHLAKVISAVKNNKPVTFVLPAFPGKSPNPEKVLGPLPDKAERLSLQFLQTLCIKIKKFYPPGVKIIICSDGRVFSDVVGMKESHITTYQNELVRLIKDMSLSYLSTFNLDDYYEVIDFIQMRQALMIHHGHSLASLKQKIQNGKTPTATMQEEESHRMYCGITRFLFEDAMHNGQTKSRTAVQKESRAKAYEVIRRSNAWSQLISKHFPNAIRLSIHPQTCGSTKLGIRLVGNDSWMTPWHGVAVKNNNDYVLLKRAEAEALGATLIYSSDGRSSHYQLKTGT
jgi:pyoverdine/dityrosine biosynthesis protein Dit1